jgi:hypothetical protein
MKYDPTRPPDPGRWLALDEEAQIELVMAYHRKRRIRLPNLHLHAAIHATVESQVAAGLELPVAAAVNRLVSEGLDRHEAIHAVGMVLTGVMFDIQRGDLAEGDPNATYLAEVAKLNRQTWQRYLEEED